MDRDFFLNAGLQFPASQPAWKLMTLMPEMNFPVDQSSADGVCGPNWEKPDQYSHFESALNSMVSSPVSGSTVSTDIMAVRELIGKLGSIRSGCGSLSQAAMTAAVPPSSSPLNSSPPPKLNLPIMDHFVKESIPIIGNSMPLNQNLPLIAADPGFAERAAKFSCFGSRSFNGRTNELGLNRNNPEFQLGSSVSPMTGNLKFPRVSSSPALRIDRSPVGFEDCKKNSEESNMKSMCLDKKFSRFSSSAANSNEESSVSEQIPSGEFGFKNQKDSNSRKRKGGSTKKEEDAIGDSNAKRSKKPLENGGKTEENTKAIEAPKDYIHVTGKAPMLDEIINYVQSLQKQVEFLSMKLATVNPSLDFDTININQSNNNHSHQIQSTFYNQNPQTIFNGSVHEFTEPFPQFPGFGQDDLQSIVQMGFGENVDL
ncbi:hypothetical protein Ccrd_017912 [Cynara cardunculus var. scolymus]|uniref:Myc-type, basic helix-loop-helix (BHLH) domain-containing protein n=1 Tax=Cynara cardunculus var. scolymus TaxID=59895 RepID=A0A103Y763_CYNCS|nr:hypothetical protein Ccrd_017912 [Cynara cardunculus var. scolymus]